MKRVALIISMSLALMPPALADQRVVTSLSIDDRIAIEQVIRSQLAAFKADDGEDAFNYASKGVRDKVGTPEAFMLMVRNLYRPVYRPRAIEFGRITLSELGPIQHLTVLDSDGAAFTAIYILERQLDGVWKIGGCVLSLREAKAA